MRGDTFAAPREPEFFGCRRLNAHAIKRNCEIVGNILAHLLDIGGKFRSLGNYSNIYVANRETVFAKQLNNPAEQLSRVRSLEGRVRVGEMITDIAHCSCSKQRIGQSMQGHVGIGMPEEPARRGHIYATENKFTLLRKLMDVKTGANSGCGHIVKFVELWSD